MDTVPLHLRNRPLGPRVLSGTLGDEGKSQVGTLLSTTYTWRLILGPRPRVGGRRAANLRPSLPSPFSGVRVRESSDGRVGSSRDGRRVRGG